MSGNATILMNRKRRNILFNVHLIIQLLASQQSAYDVHGSLQGSGKFTEGIEVICFLLLDFE